MVPRRSTWLASALLTATGCFGQYQALEGGETSATDTSTSESSTDDDTTTTTTTATTGETGCDPLDQSSCEPGFKCNPVGFPEPDTACVPVRADAHAAFEGCDEFDNSSGEDDCARGSFCYGIDKGGLGVCRPFCNMETGVPACAPSGPWNADGVCLSVQGLGLQWGWCNPWCDPTLEDPCPAGDEKCVNDGFGGVTEWFLVCDTILPQPSQLGESCVGGYQCVEGALCEDFVCRAACDNTVEPDPCPTLTRSPGSVCGTLTVTDGVLDPPGVDGLAHVGVCTL